MVNEGYPYKVNKTGLVCCQIGPANCCCDITQYSVDNDQCITGDYDKNAIYLSKCTTDGMDNTGWRETYYNDTFIQLENFGTTGGNTYMCLGIQVVHGNNVCNVGDDISLINCKQNNEAKVLFNYDEDIKRIRALNCGDGGKGALCVSYEQDKFVLNHCNSSTAFGRRWQKH